ncbi:TATA element modulatory factor 1 TATA binding protein [Niveomyces insectorum RCEF 264]|uniref:TATA element modulatory factor 1 TATA binding protein n=1 Tax=Niveomyces insectorum RCEF 264 TaxID=1081102 RepID=A0A167N735_9HYPO|nr:TATA element modulatory factor 1 TATA binding protein [Niveomyces insectorum RCEF 264]
MASSSGKSKGWGSLLSQAVAGVEARLDVILADSEEAAKQAKPASVAAAAAATTTVSNQQPIKTGTSRSGSRTRTNDRLQERLARAVAARNGPPSPSRVPSPIETSTTASPRQSVDTPNRALAESPASSSMEMPTRLSVDLAKRPSLDLAHEGGAFGKSAIEKNAHDMITDSDNASNETIPKIVLLSSGAVEAKVAEEEVATTSFTGLPTATTATTTTPISTVTKDIELNPEEVATNVSTNVAALEGVLTARIKQLEDKLEEERRQHQDELHHHTEKMEALQAKLQYVAREVAGTAKNLAQSAVPGSLEKKLAEKDQQIAELMEEGKNLGVTEQKHRAILKKLRVQIGDDEKQIAELKTALSKADAELQALRARSNRAAELEKAREEAHTHLGQLQNELETRRMDAAAKDTTIADLKAQLTAATTKINDKALAQARQRVEELEEQVATVQLEKTLAADRTKAQVAEWQDKAERAAERARLVEIEAKAEVQAIENKLEAMRVRAEEASSSALGDSQAKLLRQVETLQTQYAIASDNWQGIETTLLARVANLEKERDEALQRESDMRKKAREAASHLTLTLRVKRHEEDLEEVRSKLPKAQEDAAGAYEARISALAKRAEEAEEALQRAQMECEAHKAALWRERNERHQQQLLLQHGRERDRNEPTDGPTRRGWLEDLPSTVPGLPLPPHSPLPPPQRSSSSRPETPLFPGVPARTWSAELLGLQGMQNKLRKTSTPSSQDDPSERFALRRLSSQPPTRPAGLMNSTTGAGSSIGNNVHGGVVPMLPSPLPMVLSPTAITDAGSGGGFVMTGPPLSRRATATTSGSHATVPNATGAGLDIGGITTVSADLDADTIESLGRAASPSQSQSQQQASLLQDMVSVSTVAAGPSVQLVERMSAAIRRLESEKVAAREERARLAQQRNEARTEVLALLKDAEAGRAAAARVHTLEAEVSALQARYDTTLELLGEKSEMVEELRADVADVKAMYRDLVERTIK